MGFVEWNCPKCGKNNSESCNAYVYGSPIRYCKSCNQEYFDNRWREIALEGTDPKSKNLKFYLLGGLFFLVVSVVCGLLSYNSITSFGTYNRRIIGIAFISFIMFILFCVGFIRIITGYEEKQNKIYYDESLKRIQNKDYIEKLIFYGYNVPEQYR